MPSCFLFYFFLRLNPLAFFFFFHFLLLCVLCVWTCKCRIHKGASFFPEWLSFPRSKANKRRMAVGVCMQRSTNLLLCSRLIRSSYTQLCDAEFSTTISKTFPPHRVTRIKNWREQQLHFVTLWMDGRPAPSLLFALRMEVHLPSKLRPSDPTAPWHHNDKCARSSLTEPTINKRVLLLVCRLLIISLGGQRYRHKKWGW